MMLSPQCLSRESYSLFCCQVVFDETSCIFKHSVQPMKESFVRVFFSFVLLFVLEMRVLSLL